MNKASKLPLQERTAPAIKKKLFAKRVYFLPYTSEGVVANKQPSQPPTTVKEVANEASTEMRSKNKMRKIDKNIGK